jgi:hypothetical protein
VLLSGICDAPTKAIVPFSVNQKKDVVVAQPLRSVQATTRSKNPQQRTPSVKSSRQKHPESSTTSVIKATSKIEDLTDAFPATSYTQLTENKEIYSTNLTKSATEPTICLLDKRPWQWLSIHTKMGSVDVPVLAKVPPKLIKQWSVGVMPLMTYQRVYLRPEANQQIQAIQPTDAFDVQRMGWRAEAHLSLRRTAHAAWRIGLSYTQMQQSTQYQLATGTYTLSTQNLPQPVIEAEMKQNTETTQWQLLGLRTDRQFFLPSRIFKTCFVSVGAEGAIDIQRGSSYLLGHLSVGVQRPVTPHLHLTVEPTASYSIIGRTNTNGLLNVNPYNVGIKLSLGIQP